MKKDKKTGVCFYCGGVRDKKNLNNLLSERKIIAQFCNDPDKECRYYTLRHFEKRFDAIVSDF